MLVHPVSSGDDVHCNHLIGQWPHGLAHARGPHESLHHAIEYGVLSGGGIPNPHLIVEGGMGAVLHWGGGWNAALVTQLGRGGV